MALQRRLPSFFGLRIDQVDDVIIDVTLRSEDALIYYAADVHDIAQFCFPVNPLNPREIDIEEVSDKHVALSEVFLRRTPRCILLREYEDELLRNDNALEIARKDIPQRVELIKEMLARVAEIPDLSEMPDKAVEELERNFNVLVAVRAGIHIIGYELWKRVINTRLLRESEWSDQVDLNLQIACSTYKETALAETIRETLKAKISAELPAARRHQQIRAADTDAAAIDKLIYINRYLEGVHRSKPKLRRVVVLYLASAVRNTEIFALPAVRDALPKMEGKSFSPWRTSDQVLLGIIFRPGSDSGDSDADEYRALAGNLRQFRELLNDVHDFREPCNDCVRYGGKGVGCQAVKLCRLVRGNHPSTTPDTRDFLALDGASYPNLGLLANIGRFSELLRGRPKRKKELEKAADEQSRNKGRKREKIFTGVKPRQVIKLFNDLFRQREIQALALDKLWVVQQRLEMGVQLMQWAPPPLKKQVITHPLQVLPFAIEIPPGRYREIIKELVEAWLLLPTNADRFNDRLVHLYQQFIALDRTVTRFQPIHELIRAEIFLSYERVGGPTGRSVARVENIIQRLQSEEEKVVERWKREFQYILLFALRGERKFKDCDDLATELLEQHPFSAKIWHAALLNRYQWFEEGESPYSVAQLVACAQAALKSYEDGRADYEKTFCDGDLVDRLIEVCLNDVGYLSCFSVPPENLALSVQHLDLLAARVPRDEWTVAYPQYGHTYAMLLYRQGQKEMPGDARGALQRFREADGEIKRVLKILDTDDYRALSKKICVALAEAEKLVG